jgi:DNA-binding response OmpR family regulator
VANLSEASILVVEDAPEYQLLVKKAIGESVSHKFVSTLAEGREALEAGKFDLIVLDVNLPDGDGFQFAAELQDSSEFSSIPIIFLTVRAEVGDKVLGLSIGAVDYIVKPFELLEFRARVLNKLNRHCGPNEQSSVYGPFDLDFGTYKLTISRKDDKEEVELSPLEVKLMSYFIKNKENVLSRDQILDGVWGNAVHVQDRTVDSAIAALRKKLGEEGSLVRSVHGVGYKLAL